MTREFDKQRRNDSRPSFRNRSANSNGNERSPRPARPRLNREIVDRAWESGAQQTHDDYRPRAKNGQAPQRDRRNQQPPAYSSSQNGRGGNRPYNNGRNEQYRDNPRRFERAPGENSGPRSRSFDSSSTNRREYTDRRSDDRRDFRPRTNNPERRSDGYRDTRNSGQYREHGPQFQRRDQSQDYRRRDERNDRNSYGRNSFEGNTRGRRGGYQDQRSGPDTRSPQRQNRPWEQDRTRSNSERPPRPAYNDRNERSERFQGDYERFNSYDQAPNRRDDARRPGRPTDRAPRERQRFEDRSRSSEHTEEKHVTRMPDGRVIKGPRPVQRKEARFWGGISEDTNDLVEQASPPQSEGKEGNTKNTSNKPAKARRTRSASAAVRAKRTNTANAVGKSGPRPSQRGFKWPSS